jgi:hypothetical protein
VSIDRSKFSGARSKSKEGDIHHEVRWKSIFSDASVFKDEREATCSSLIRVREQPSIHVRTALMPVERCDVLSLYAAGIICVGCSSWCGKIKLLQHHVHCERPEERTGVRKTHRAAGRGGSGSSSPLSDQSLSAFDIVRSGSVP